MPAPGDNQPGYYGWANQETCALAAFIEAEDHRAATARQLVDIPLEQPGPEPMPARIALAIAALIVWIATCYPDACAEPAMVDWRELVEHFASDWID